MFYVFCGCKSAPDKSQRLAELINVYLAQHELGLGRYWMAMQSREHSNLNEANAIIMCVEDVNDIEAGQMFVVHNLIDARLVIEGQDNARVRCILR